MLSLTLLFWMSDTYIVRFRNGEWSFTFTSTRSLHFHSERCIRRLWCSLKFSFMFARGFLYRANFHSFFLIQVSPAFVITSTGYLSMEYITPLIEVLPALEPLPISTDHRDSLILEVKFAYSHLCVLYWVPSTYHILSQVLNMSQWTTHLQIPTLSWETKQF